MSCDDPLTERIKVVHLGADQGQVGGIGSVVETLVRAAGQRFRAESLATVDSRSRLRSIVLASRALRHIFRLRISDGNLVIVHAHVSQGGSLLREGGLLTFARLIGLTTVVTVHGSRFERSAKRHKILTQVVVVASSHTFVLTASTEQLIRKLVPAAQLTRIGNPVSMGLEIGSGDRLEGVIFAGEVGWRKGVDVLLRAWPVVCQRVSGAMLTVIGPIAGDVVLPGSEWLEQNHVTLLGPCPAPIVRKILRESAVAVLPSRAEALPRFLLEAMAESTPFVATDVGQVKELTAAGAGLLVNAGDVDGLADALTAILTDKLGAARMGQRGYDLAKASFSDSRVTQTYESRYDELIGDRSVAGRSL